MAAMQVVTFRLQVMVLVKVGLGKLQVRWPIRQKDNGNKEQWETEKQRKELNRKEQHRVLFTRFQGKR